eukprot:3232010-Rhodomonas_salina.2
MERECIDQRVLAQHEDLCVSQPRRTLRSANWIYMRLSGLPSGRCGGLNDAPVSGHRHRTITAAYNIRPRTPPSSSVYLQSKVTQPSLLSAVGATVRCSFMAMVLRSEPETQTVSQLPDLLQAIDQLLGSRNHPVHSILACLLEAELPRHSRKVGRVAYPRPDGLSGALQN